MEQYRQRLKTSINWTNYNYKGMNLLVQSLTVVFCRLKNSVSFVWVMELLCFLVYFLFSSDAHMAFHLSHPIHSRTFNSREWCQWYSRNTLWSSGWTEGIVRGISFCRWVRLQWRSTSCSLFLLPLLPIMTTIFEKVSHGWCWSIALGVLLWYDMIWYDTMKGFFVMINGYG